MKRMHVHVAVQDIPNATKFYSALFATQPTVVKPDYAKWMLDDPRLNFAISKRGKHPGLDHLGIQVESQEELHEVYTRLRKAGGNIIEQGETACCYAKSEVVDRRSGWALLGNLLHQGRDHRIRRRHRGACSAGRRCESMLRTTGRPRALASSRIRLLHGRGAGAVKLYMFEHCSLCFRVRMTAALKRRHLQETVVLDDDTETMFSLVGKRVIPILVKDDGAAMLESMDMVRYVNGLGDPVLTGDERPEIAAWADRVVSKTAPLTMPRYPLLGLPEFATVAALDHYNLRKRKAFGDFVELRANTRRYIGELMPDLEELDRLDREAARNQWHAIARRCASAPSASIRRRRQRPSLAAEGPRLF